LKRKIISEINANGESQRWPRSVVPYEFQDNIDPQAKQNVLSAMQHWHERTCIRFEPYNAAKHRDIYSKIVIQDNGPGCASYVGYRPGSDGFVFLSTVFLPVTCPFGSAVHELGHVIGFYHEMSRTDRDQNILLYFNRMSQIEASQYDIMPDPQPNYYGQPYDLYSVMHYYGTDVMLARDSRRAFLMGMSFLDIKLANLGYHCGDKCSGKPICENEGYINQNCRCSCPDGFSGYQCNILMDVQVPSIGKSVSHINNAQPHVTTLSSSHNDWLPWTPWSICSETCGKGVRVRTRVCPEGAKCSGSSFEIESCKSSSCKGCTRVIDITSRSPVAITSPNYPSDYQSNLECYYYIRVPQGYKISLQFADFNLPTNTGVCQDNVELRYYHLGMRRDCQPGPQYCGDSSGDDNFSFLSTKNYIMLIFRTNQDTLSGRGFSAMAQVV
ncbi:unnamed protein product, partial [Didymodactylos carnosus]